MIDVSFIQKILDISQAEILDIDGRTYTTKQVNPVKDPTPAELQIGSLTGLADYINLDLDGVKSNLIIWVGNPETVTVLSKLEKTWQTRNHYIMAKPYLPKVQFGQWLDLESFNIMLQSMFVDEHDRAAVLQIVGNVKDENVNSYADDGVSQQVTAKVGVAKVADVKVPNPVTLTPYRTFCEIEQPESAFIFRMKSGGYAALFEADGGEWKAEAMWRIASWLKEHIPDVPVIA